MLTDAAAISILLFNTVLTIPITAVSIITLTCREGNIYYPPDAECFGPYHAPLAVLAIINLIVVVVEGQFYWFLYYEKDPFSKSYFSINHGLPRLGKFLLKMVSAIYFGADID